MGSRIRPCPECHRLGNRRELLKQFDKLRNDLDLRGSMKALDAYSQQAVDMVLGQRAQEAFDISREPERNRQRYGNHLWCQEALLARRLVEAGATTAGDGPGSLRTERASGTTAPPQ